MRIVVSTIVLLLLCLGFTSALQSSETLCPRPSQFLFESANLAFIFQPPVTPTNESRAFLLFNINPFPHRPNLDIVVPMNLNENRTAYAHSIRYLPGGSRVGGVAVYTHSPSLLCTSSPLAYGDGTQEPPNRGPFPPPRGRYSVPRFERPSYDEDAFYGEQPEYIDWN